ncbi:MAG TPA: CBS domain-containing protein [Acidobacteriota bacterium]|jgi:CBS domain-containing protein
MDRTDKIKEILKRKGRQVWSIAPDRLVYEALELMAEKNCGALLVISEDILVGIFSERDYARKVILKGKGSKETLVRDIMTSSVVSVDPENTVDECMRLMTEGRLRHLPVVENGKVAGLVSIGDLVNWVISAQEESIHQLHDYIVGKYPG